MGTQCSIPIYFYRCLQLSLKIQAAATSFESSKSVYRRQPGKMDLIEWVLFDDDTLSVYKDALSKLQISKIVVGTPMLDSINMMLRETDLYDIIELVAFRSEDAYPKMINA